MLAQYLSAASYGRFSVALAFAMILGYFTDVGLSNTVLREGSKSELTWIIFYPRM
ncbi:oligosaccharide flippase family protein [Bacillus megaterium]|nr:oligosaccharide flippase family protein [Priestia megaterium]